MRLTLTVRHERTTGYLTRVDVPVVLKPGKNSVRIGVDEMVNVNGSEPDLANVNRWYLACDDPGPDDSPLPFCPCYKAVTSAEAALK